MAPSDGQQRDTLPVFVLWMEFLAWLLPTTEKFPRRARFTLAERIDRLALDVVEDLVEAQYSRDKARPLRSANLRLEKLRVLLRLSHHLRHLSARQYEHGVRSLYEVGRMVGGWRRWQERRS